MKNTKLFQLLETFDTRDWQQFGQYVRSPFFNQTEVLVSLTEVLENWFKKRTEKEQELSKSQLYQLIRPEQPYADADCNRLCSRLLNLATDFLAYQAWQGDGVMPHYHTLQAFLERKLDKHFRFVLQKAEQILEQEEVRNIHFCRQKYMLSEIAEWQLSGQKAGILGPKVQEAADNFDLYFVTQKLQHLSSIASLNTLQPDTFQSHFAPKIMEMADQLQQIPIIRIYRNLYLMLTDTDAPKHFEQLKSLAIEHEAILAQRELNFIYLTLINFCIGRIRYGEKEYATALLDLYEKALENGFLTDKGVVSPWTFKNVVKLGLGLQRYTWVEDFIHQYGAMLAEQERGEAMNFNLADLHYHQQNYEKAQLHLREVEFSDIRYYLHGRILLAKIYYTTEAWEALDSLLSAFKIYLLRSKKMGREEKKPYLNFIRILDKILRSLSEKRQTIKQTILQTPMLTARTWLLEIVDHG